MTVYANPLKRRAKIWLIFAAIFCAFWLFLWLSYDSKTKLAVKQSSARTTADYTLPNKIDELHELSNLVAPIDFQTITRDLRNYPDEFKDKKYFQDHKDKWTVQVMDVMEHKIIVDYLQNRSDRKKFAYFRYTDEKGVVRYILTYGVMSSFQEALGATKLIDFKLPNSTRVLPEQMQRYLDLIDNYERGTVYDDDGVDVEPVKLTEAVKEVEPAPAPKTEPVKQTTIDIQEVAQNMADAPDSRDIKAAPTAKPVQDSDEKDSANVSVDTNFTETNEDSSKPPQKPAKTKLSNKDTPNSKKEQPQKAQSSKEQSPKSAETSPAAKSFEELQ